MKLMCAMWAFEWRFELASVFALFRERSFQKDTIPKPGGLGSGKVHEGYAVRCLSGACPVSVRDLSGATWKRHFSAF
jgi:hypothetical protein